jgi:Flp pilus assembly protein TadG
MSLNIKRTKKRTLKSHRGSMAVLAAVMIPGLVAFGSLAIDASYYGYRNLLLRQTVQSAALAAANNLRGYFSSGTGSTATVTAAAQSFAQANMPVGLYGNVVSASNVVVGNWDSGSSTFTSLASSGGTTPNAVQVTGLSTAANGNGVAMFLGSMFGKASVDITTTVIASYTTALPFNTIVINDMSQSFSSMVGTQQKADKSILNCVQGASGSASQFGITGFTGHATIYQPLTQASTNIVTLLANILGLNSCGNLLMPACSGSNIAAGLYSAIQQFSGPSYAGTKRNIVIITDGVPNANSGEVYTTADGIYPTPTSSTPTCTTHCTDANLLTMAQNQAAVANAAGISISTIYYSGDTPGDQQAGYAASLATLATGNGISLVAPNQSQLGKAYAGFCATIPSALKTVM